MVAVSLGSQGVGLRGDGDRADCAAATPPTADPSRGGEAVVHPRCLAAVARQREEQQQGAGAIPAAKGRFETPKADEMRRPVAGPGSGGPENHDLGTLHAVERGRRIGDASLNGHVVAPKQLQGPLSRHVSGCFLLAVCANWGENRRSYPSRAKGIFIVSGYSTVSNSYWGVELWVTE